MPIMYTNVIVRNIWVWQNYIKDPFISLERPFKLTSSESFEHYVCINYTKTSNLYIHLRKQAFNQFLLKDNALLPHQCVLHSLEKTSFLPVSSERLGISYPNMRHWCVGNQHKWNVYILTKTMTTDLAINLCFRFRTETCQGCQSMGDQVLFSLQFFRLDCTSAFSAFCSNISSIRWKRKRDLHLGRKRKQKKQEFLNAILQ